MMEEFAHTPLEKQYLRTFLLRSMQIACGVKELCKTLGITETDDELRNEFQALDKHAALALTCKELNDFCTGKRFHPLIDKLRNKTAAWHLSKTSPLDYDKQIADMQKKHTEDFAQLKKIHQIEIDNMKSGIAAAGTEIAQLNGLMTSQEAQIRQIGITLPALRITTKITSELASERFQLKALHESVQTSLTALNDLTTNPSTPLGTDTAAILQALMPVVASLQMTGSASGGTPDPAFTAEFEARIQELEESHQNLEAQLRESNEQVEEWEKFYADVHKNFVKVVNGALNSALCIASGVLKQSEFTSLADPLKSLQLGTTYKKILSKEGTDTQFTDSVVGLTLLREHLTALKRTNDTLLKKKMPPQSDVHLKTALESAFPSAPPPSSGDGLGELLDSVAMFSVPRRSFGKMICAQYEVGKSILIPCSAYKFEDFAGDPDFCALVFDVGEQTIKACIPETNNPILYVETRSLMQLLITQSKMAALYAFFSPFFQGTSEQQTYYLKTLSKLIPKNLCPGGVQPTQ
jgi:hypothetical protein